MTVHLPHGFTLTNTCSTKNTNNRCFGYDAFECHAFFHINCKLLAHRDQQKHVQEKTLNSPQKPP